MGPIAANHGKYMAKAIRPLDNLNKGEQRVRERNDAYFVIVPSISEMTTLSVCSQTKMRAVQAMTPEADNENVIEFAPDLRFNVF